MIKYKLRRIIIDKDMDDIYAVFSNYREQYKLCSVMNTNSKDAFSDNFVKKLTSNYKDFVIIESDGRFAGFIATYDYKIIDCHIKVMIYLQPEFRGGELGLVGIDFLNILFQYYNINKVYTEVYAYNYPSIKLHEQVGMTEECRLKEYKFFDGKFWDVIFYSISRDTFYDRNSSIISRFLETSSLL